MFLQHYKTKKIHIFFFKSALCVAKQEAGQLLPFQHGLHTSSAMPTPWVPPPSEPPFAGAEPGSGFCRFASPRARSSSPSQSQGGQSTTGARAFACWWLSILQYFWWQHNAVPFHLLSLFSLRLLILDLADVWIPGRQNSPQSQLSSKGSQGKWNHLWPRTPLLLPEI